MEKLNARMLEDARNKLYAAGAIVTLFDCKGIDCDACPMRYDGRCAATILSELYNAADKRVREAENEL